MASQAIAERTANPVQIIRQNLAQMAPEFKAALPAHVSVEKFTRVAMTAIQNNPDLQHADRRTLFGSIVRLAQDGLLPDGREAALVIFRTKINGEWVDAVQAMPMLAGLLKKVRQSGDVAKVAARVVHEHDEFAVDYGFEDTITHKLPPLNERRGAPIGAYAVAVLKDGSKYVEVMSLEEIEKVRSVSKTGSADRKDKQGNAIAPKGPWVDWWGEMARKTVFRRMSKWLPMSADLEETFQRDETMGGARFDGEPVTAIRHEPPSNVSRLDALEQHIEGETLDADDWQEGPADEQRGEETETPHWQQAVELALAGAQNARTLGDLRKVDADWQKARGPVPDDQAARVDDMIAAARRELQAGAE